MQVVTRIELKIDADIERRLIEKNICCFGKVILKLPGVPKSMNHL